MKSENSTIHPRAKTEQDLMCTDGQGHAPEILPRGTWHTPNIRPHGTPYDDSDPFMCRRTPEILPVLV